MLHFPFMSMRRMLEHASLSISVGIATLVLSEGFILSTSLNSTGVKSTDENSKRI